MPAFNIDVILVPKPLGSAELMTLGSRLIKLGEQTRVLYTLRATNTALFPNHGLSGDGTKIYFSQTLGDKARAELVEYLRIHYGQHITLYREEVIELESMVKNPQAAAIFFAER